MRAPLHRRPVLGPFVYFASSVFAGSEGYVFGFLLMNNARSGLYCAAFMEVLLLLYLLECARVAEKSAE